SGRSPGARLRRQLRPARAGNPGALRSAAGLRRDRPVPLRAQSDVSRSGRLPPGLRPLRGVALDPPPHRGRLGRRSHLPDRLRRAGPRGPFRIGLHRLQESRPPVDPAAAAVLVVNSAEMRRRIERGIVVLAAGALLLAVAPALNSLESVLDALEGVRSFKGTALSPDGARTAWVERVRSREGAETLSVVDVADLATGTTRRISAGADARAHREHSPA